MAELKQLFYIQLPTLSIKIWILYVAYVNEFKFLTAGHSTPLDSVKPITIFGGIVKSLYLGLIVSVSA